MSLGEMEKGRKGYARVWVSKMKAWKFGKEDEVVR